MNINEVYPSKYIAASDLNNQNVRVTIARVDLEKIGDDTKPVIYFKGKQKGLVCNKTNSKTIAMIYGDETDDWSGGELILFPIMTDYQGKPVEAVRVRAPQPKDNPRSSKVETAPQKMQRSENPAEDDAMSDPIPF
jgi:hypothetical protein